MLKKNKGKTDSTFIKAKPPKYYPKKDLGICGFACPVQRILKQKFKKTGKIQLSGLSEEIAFQSKIINSLEKFDTIQQIRVVPNSKEKAKCTYIDIELIYDAKKLALLEPKIKSFKDNQNINQVILEQFEHLEEKANKNKKEEQIFTFNQEELIALNQRLCGVDLNLNQIALSFTQNQQDIKNGKAISSLFNIKPLKSINQYYNKRKAKLQSRLDDAKNKLKDLEDRSSFYYGYLHEFLSLETIDKVKDFLTILVKQLKNKIKRLKSFPQNVMIK